MAFRFKEFTVEDRNSTMPVGTDAMLLGAWTDPGDAVTILDVGTGCGVLALMMAQKSGGMIEAIDIDESSVEEASSNFYASPWGARMKAINAGFGDFVASAGRTFDLVISNPPFFSGSLRSQHHRKNLAKHDTGLDLPGLISGIRSILSPSGRLSVVVPANLREQLMILAEEASLSPCRFLVVKSVVGKPPTRLLASFSVLSCPDPVEESLAICSPGGGFTGEYLSLTRNFHYF